MGRIITIQVEVTDKSEALWIWYAHMNNKSEHGVYIQAIHEGPIPKESEKDDE